MLSTTSSQAFRESDPYELLIQQIIFLESQPKFNLEDRRTELEGSKTILDELDSRLSAFDTVLDDFLDPLSHPFDGRAVSLNDTTAFTATATDSAVLGSHTLQVDRLAIVDTRLSDMFTSTNTDIVSLQGTGSKSFTISVASPTDADADNREDITVNVTISAGETDDEILTNVASAINSAMLSAVNNDTIDSDNRAYASVVNETSDNSRLSLRAGETGYSNRLDFTSDPDNLLSDLGISNASLVSGATGGYAATVGTSEDTSDLTSQILLDGLTIYRNSNQLTDVLDGVTINLSQTNASAVEFSVTPDSSGIQADVEDFIEKYNAVLSYIKQQSRVNGDTGARGEFAGDTTFTSLRFNMRTDLISEVTSQSADAPSFITDIGIEVNSDGSLELEDADALIQAVEENSDAVRTLFAADDGVGTRLQDRIEDFVNFNGLINDRKETLDTRIRTINRRITRFDEALTRREESLREEFARLQESIELLQGQQFSLSAFS